MVNYTETQELVYKMMTENTGKHILDSGFANGRHWQKNEVKTIQDFDNEPIESYEFDFDNGDIVRNVNIFHYLSECTELDELCNEFNKIQDESNDWDADADVYGVSIDAWDLLNLNDDLTLEYTFNTYNGDSDLSQVLQGSRLDINGELYYIIQIHNGADVRGGYTDAKLFKCGEYCDGLHEYVWDYKCSLEVMDDVNEGYIEEFTGYFDSSKKYTSKEVLKRLEELKLIEA